MRVARFDLIKLFLLFRFLLLLFAFAVLSSFFGLGWILLLLGLLAVLLLFLGRFFSCFLFELSNHFNWSNFPLLSLNGQFDILFACEILRQQQ